MTLNIVLGVYGTDFRPRVTAMSLLRNSSLPFLYTRTYIIFINRRRRPSVITTNNVRLKTASHDRKTLAKFLNTLYYTKQT